MDTQTLITLFIVAAAAVLWFRQMFIAKASGCGACPQKCKTGADNSSLTQLDVGLPRVDKQGRGPRR
ncbi:hypothetical protein [Rubinisphaera brasiliensis]|uniref:FeoB-associated Cys-rich membrane protein n=1 Tax=Rubinisphaera brasiliensis (strain ATCC 49424 / DSM 5305 / JCM 21570 / IAM 15109 / NBRC 103401 / IFAM 1448) TaxID=756272 RepID=F0SN27_RUBBR|nr:hypothetical protein [Rubinisphaera brasiliensis]ADY61056.1 hypothetical protein Plabr_3459 [Rubinisphaera brasiliensis DSM 5305]